MMDPSGLYGELISYALLIFLVGAAFIIFVYLWANGKLDFDEQPKHQMLKDAEVSKNIHNLSDGDNK